MNSPADFFKSPKLLLFFMASSANAQLFHPYPNLDPEAHNCHAQGYLMGPSSAVCVVPAAQRPHLHASNPGHNPLLDALLLSSSLGLHTNTKTHSYNHIDHLPLNPYLALLLSHYGKHTPVYGSDRRGLYGYNAANNYHNNQPFGSYKIHEDA